jgi:hypothetical protein
VGFSTPKTPYVVDKTPPKQRKYKLRRILLLTDKSLKGIHRAESMYGYFVDLLVVVIYAGSSLYFYYRLPRKNYCNQVEKMVAITSRHMLEKFHANVS